MEIENKKEIICEECNKKIFKNEQYEGFVLGNFCSKHCMEEWSLKADTCKCEDI